MKHVLSAALLCAALTGTAGAATLGLTVDPTIAVTGLADVSNDPADFGLTVFGDGMATSTGFTSMADIAFLAFMTIDQAVTSGGLFLSDFFNDLSGDLLASGFTGTDAVDGTDVIELLFGNLTGGFASVFGQQAQLTLVGEFGATPFASPFSAPGVLATLNPVVQDPVGPVPLPATLPLMVAALALGALIRRRAPR